MFGINSQAVDQNTGVINSYNQELPVGGEDLIAATNQQQNLNPAQPISNDPMAFNQPQQHQTQQIVDTGDGDLIEIKKDALQQLTPLVGHLEQSPEEKFRTTMMLIQATDDKSLLKSAYQAALQIGEEKARAQALLDVVNEINYFTHPDVQ